MKMITKKLIQQPQRLSNETKREDYLKSISYAQAVRLFRAGKEVFILNDDDSESLIYTAEELGNAIANRQELGIEKMQLNRLQKGGVRW